MKGVGLIALACLCWALDGLIRYPLVSKGPSVEQIVLVEHIILLFALAPFMPFLKKKWSKKDLFPFVMVGAAGSALGTLTFTKAFIYINPSLVILLQKLQPLVAISLAVPLLKEKIRPEFIFWAALCLLSGLLISYRDLLPLFSGEVSLKGEQALQGYALTLFAVLAWGSATVFGKKLSAKWRPQEIMSGRFTLGALACLPFAFSSFKSEHISQEVILPIVAMAALSGVIGMGLYYKGLKRLSARAGTLAELFFPLFAVCVNWIFLGKTLHPEQIVGGLLLLLGSSVIQVKHY